MKTCFKCGIQKLREDFYVHRQMADGLLGKCKECTKSDVAARAILKRPEITAYEKRRSVTPHRLAKRVIYLRTHRAAHPEKNAARAAVALALRQGTLKRLPCEVCANPKSQAHHDDYSKPLDVRWLCDAHHKEHHRKAA